MYVLLLSTWLTTRVPLMDAATRLPLNEIDSRSQVPIVAPGQPPGVAPRASTFGIS